jgi:hypothetical protein
MSFAAGIKFPRWVPKDAQEAVTSLYEAVVDDLECRCTLQRIATHDYMKDVWAQQFENISPDMLVGLTFLTWNSARRIPLMRKPVSKVALLGGSASEPNPFEIASQARAIANALNAIHPEILAANKLTEVTQQELDRVAAFFERQGDELRFWTKFATPSRKVRAHNADQIAFVNRLCRLWSRIGLRRRPYSLVAILTNVAFDVPAHRLWDADRVKHCYGSRSHSK